jgi:hypothetical protein
VPIGNLIVLGSIVAVFGVFIVVLAAVAWWTGRAPAPAALQPVANPAPADRASVQLHS